MFNKKIRGITVQLGGDTSGLRKALDEADKALNSTQRELNAVQKGLKFDPSNAKLAAQQQELLKQAIKQTADKLKALEDNQEKVNKAFAANDEWEKQYAPIKAEIEKTTEALKKFKEQEADFKAKHESGAISDKEYEEFTKSLNEAKAACESAKEKKKELDKQFTDGHINAEQYREYEREVEKTRGQLRQLEEQMHDTGAAAKTIDGNFGEFAGTAKRHAADLVKAFAAVTAAAIVVGKKALEAGMEFDKGMSNVAATMGYGWEELANSGSEAAQTFEMLSEFAQELGRSTAYSAVDASEALNFMALAGYDAEKSMVMLPKVLNLAAAGEIELASASDMVTDAQSALGLSVDETAQLVDKMAKTSSKTNTSVGQLGEAILKIGGTAKSIRGGTTELTATLGVLADNGIKGAEGGTHLRNVLLSLQKAAKDGAIAVGDMTVSVYDATGEMRAVPDIFGDIQTALDGMTEAEADAAKSVLFNKTDLAAVNALLGTTAERWDELTGEIENADGAAQRMADTKLDNLAGDIVLFKSAVEGAKIAVAEDLTPSLRKATQIGTKAVSAMADGFGKSGLRGAVEAAHKVIDKELGDSAKTIYNLEAATTAAATAWLTYKAVSILENTAKAISVVNQGLQQGKTLTEAMNAAALKNPYAIIAAVAIAAGTAIKKFIDIETDLIDEVGIGYEVLSEKQQAVLDANASLSQQMSESKSKYEDAARSADLEASAAERLAKRLYELDDAENLSAEQKAEMRLIVDELNSSVEGLNVQLDEETGHLKTERTEIEAGIKALQKRAKAAAAEERYVDLYKQQITAEENRAAAMKKVQEAKVQLKSAEIELNKATERRNQLEAEYTRDGNLVATKEQLKEMNDEYDRAVRKYDEAETALSAMQSAYTTAGQSLADVNGEIDSLTQTLGDEAAELSANAAEISSGLDNVAQSAENASGKIDKVFTITEEEVEDTLSKIDELTNAYNSKVSNQEGILDSWVENNLRMDADSFSLADWQSVLNSTQSTLDNWDKQIAALADRTDKNGKRLVSDGILEHLKTLGPEGIKYVQALTNGTDTELAIFSETWEKTYKSIPEIAQEQYEELRKTTDKEIDKLLEDVRSQSSSVASTFNDLGINGIDGYIAAWNDPQKRAELEAAVRSAVRLAADSAADEQDSHSPSKVYRKLGGDAGEGYVLGVKDEVKAAAQAASELVNAAIEAGSGAKLQLPQIDYSTALPPAYTPQRTPEQPQSVPAADIKSEIGEMISELVSGDVTIPMFLDESGQERLAVGVASKVNVLLGEDLSFRMRGY